MCHAQMTSVAMVQKGAAVLQQEDVKGQVVSVKAAVTSFMWNYGVWCRAGVRPGGGHNLEAVRQRAAEGNAGNLEIGKGNTSLKARKASRRVSIFQNAESVNANAAGNNLNLPQLAE
ncbi:hypothetical protein CYMTET_33551 [Cymbomonas tetramitiformis]|uniref:Uncharacterized protein n=1 Tax=Cymbomonas tetramitiformis TaxID=36881 RepID=A0AAE0KR26_9CHLO|nr:hypothetical protein CYMTET_33551 [Cymbomonas tetramitiformis]